MWIHCCQVRNTVGLLALICQWEKPSALPMDCLCHSETVVRRAQRRSRAGGLQQPDKERPSGLHSEGCLGQGAGLSYWACHHLCSLMQSIRGLVWASGFVKASGRVTNCPNFPATQEVSQDLGYSMLEPEHLHEPAQHGHSVLVTVMCKLSWDTVLKRAHGKGRQRRTIPAFRMSVP